MTRLILNFSSQAQNKSALILTTANINSWIWSLTDNALEADTDIDISANDILADIGFPLHSLLHLVNANI